jgi:hypothetical protein
MKACQQVYKLMHIIIRQYDYTDYEFIFFKETIIFGTKVKCLITLKFTHIILLIWQHQYASALQLDHKYST